MARCHMGGGGGDQNEAIDEEGTQLSKEEDAVEDQEKDAREKSKGRKYGLWESCRETIWR